MSEKTIWEYLKAQGLTDAGAAGLMGNLYAESGLRPNNLQNSYEGKLGMADAEYTEMVDRGTYANFGNDRAAMVSLNGHIPAERPPGRVSVTWRCSSVF